MFYGFQSIEKKLHCFDKDGVFVDNIDLRLDLQEYKETLDTCCYYDYKKNTLNFKMGYDKMFVYSL